MNEKVSNYNRYSSYILILINNNGVCDVTLSVYIHTGGNRTHDLWNTSPMLCQLSYAVRSVRVSDISEPSLVPSISM